jgi:tripartite-type tricarboxylate transporter receptor subunit TctC
MTNARRTAGSMLGIAIAGAALLLGAARAGAEDYPVRPVKLVVPYAAGGGTDALARFLAKGLEQRLGQPFVIENRSGSGTTLGGAMVARAQPDGYTLLMATSSTLALAPGLYKKLPYDPNGFSPVSMVGTIPFVLVVHPSLGVSTVAELVALAKAKPGTLSFASAGVGTPHHIFAELFTHLTGTDIKHVPYRGGGPALVDVLAGHVPLMFEDVAPALEQVRAGKVRALAVSTGRRIATMPDVPTMQEAGIAGYEANSWQCIVGPGGMPEPIVARLHAALAEFIASPEAQSHFRNLGLEPLTGTPGELAGTIRSEAERWTGIIAGMGLSVE